MLISKESSTETMVVPLDVVDVACVIGAHGVDGLIKLKVYNSKSHLLSSIDEWWLRSPVFEWKRVRLVSFRWIDSFALVQLKDFDDRNKAEGVKGASVGISRSKFPIIATGEYYWVDLCSMPVFNLQEEFLGQVVEVFDTGASAVLRVRNPVRGSFGLSEGKIKNSYGKDDILIPFVDTYVMNVDQSAHKILVDWQRDY